MQNARSYFFINSKKKINRKRFSPKEDNLLLQIVLGKRTNDWNTISLELSKLSQDRYQRTPRQCKDRYLNYLNPEIVNKEWTNEEDECFISNYILNQFQFSLTHHNFKLMFKNLYIMYH